MLRWSTELLMRGARIKVMRFIVVGATGFLLNVGILHLLVVAGMQYLAASVIAVILSLIVGFNLQKYVTFREPSVGGIPLQGLLYVAYFGFSVGANSLLLLFAVELLSLHYLVGQAFASIVLAFGSYFFYDRAVFKAREIREKISAR